MSDKRRKFTPEFRAEAVKLVTETGRPVAQVAAEIGVGAQLLGRWVKLSQPAGSEADQALDISERAELERLRKENADLRLNLSFQKSRGPLRLRSEPVEMFRLIDAEKTNYTVIRMAALLQVSRSGYYKWAAAQSAGPSPTIARRTGLDVKVAQFHRASDQVYGSPRTLADLRDDGETVSRKTAAASMRRQ